MLKKVGVALGAGVLVLVGSAFGVKAYAASRLAAPVNVGALASAGAANVENGKRLATVVLGCPECHGADLSGLSMADDPMFGTIAAPNLTTPKRTLAQWDASIRHGIGSSGRALVMMPSEAYTGLSLSDFRDLAAYLDSLAPIERSWPETSLGPIGSMLVLNGELHVYAWQIDHAAVKNTEDAPLPARGAYLMQVSGCRSCHGEQLEGREVQPGKPPAPPLNAAAIANWSEASFTKALREGVSPRDGHQLDLLMPWKAFASLSDDEVHDLWEALRGPEHGAAPTR